MNESPSPRRAGPAYFLAVLGALLIVAVLVLLMQRYARPTPLEEDRAATRAKAFKELRAAEAQALSTTAWLDKGKGLVRLRIDDAMAIVDRDWGKDPAAARSNLSTRVEKATAPPPKAPEKKSDFE